MIITATMVAVILAGLVLTGAALVLSRIPMEQDPDYPTTWKYTANEEEADG